MGSTNGVRDLANNFCRARSRKTCTDCRSRLADRLQARNDDSVLLHNCSAKQSSLPSPPAAFSDTSYHGPQGNFALKHPLTQPQRFCHNSAALTQSLVYTQLSASHISAEPV